MLLLLRAGHLHRFSLLQIRPRHQLLLLLVVAHIAYVTHPTRPAALELLTSFLDTCLSDAAPETIARIDATVRTLVTHAAAALDQAPATHIPLLRLLAVLVVRGA